MQSQNYLLTSFKSWSKCQNSDFGQYLNKNEETNTEKGYIEIWWEPYYECLIGNECIAKEFGVTKIRFIYQDNSLVEIENNLEFLHFKINNENQLNSIVQKICPSEIDQFVEDFLVAEESVKLEILAQSKTNCRLKTIDEKRVRFGKRSILHNFPIIFEDNEVDLKLENFKPYTESVPRDDFIDLINQRNTPYFKPRLIEVLNN